jgi:hypothetical protein
MEKEDEGGRVMISTSQYALFWRIWLLPRIVPEPLTVLGGVMTMEGDLTEERPTVLLRKREDRKGREQGRSAVEDNAAAGQVREASGVKTVTVLTLSALVVLALHLMTSAGNNCRGSPSQDESNALHAMVNEEGL